MSTAGEMGQAYSVNLMPKIQDAQKGSPKRGKNDGFLSILETVTGAGSNTSIPVMQKGSLPMVNAQNVIHNRSKSFLTAGKGKPSPVHQEDKLDSSKGNLPKSKQDPNKGIQAVYASMSGSVVSLMPQTIVQTAQSAHQKKSSLGSTHNTYDQGLGLEDPSSNKSALSLNFLNGKDTLQNKGQGQAFEPLAAWNNLQDKSGSKQLDTKNKVLNGSSNHALHNQSQVSVSFGFLDKPAANGVIKDEISTSSLSNAQNEGMTVGKSSKNDNRTLNAQAFVASGVHLTQPAIHSMTSMQAADVGGATSGTIQTLDTGKSTWMNDLGQMITSNDNGGSIQVKVHPEGMGDLLISVSQTSSGMQIHVEANQLSTAQWLGQQTQELANAVLQLGVSVANIQVGFGQASLSYSENGQQNRKSTDERDRIRAVSHTMDGGPLLAELGTLKESGLIYSQGSSISLHA